jgi:inositol-phosphate phosphatase/L-galactose 1-phosphate phosphatase/histidinol-phosphatase
VTTNLNELISFANHLADEVEPIIKKYFRTKLSIDNKKDESPVTIADKKTELRIRELIGKKYPDHGILGEEFEDKNINSEYLWVIDPIDGTRSFIAGHKDFGTLIALLHNKKPIIGIINCPMHGERWVGVEGRNTLMNGTEINTSTITSVDKSYLNTTGLYFDQDDHFKKGYNEVIKQVRHFRFGGDCYMYGLVASGFVEIVLENNLKTHDYMALIPVIKGAGGEISDKFGDPITLKSDGSIVSSANKKLHAQIIGIINK